jgi:hypothetical protein
MIKRNLNRYSMTSSPKQDFPKVTENKNKLDSPPYVVRREKGIRIRWVKTKKLVKLSCTLSGLPVMTTVLLFVFNPCCF